MASNLIKLNNGIFIPALGFGTFASEGTADEGTMQKAVVIALETGYRHLDCAWYYKNEHEVGAGIREFLSNHKDVKREDIFVTTKVWPHLTAPEDVEWSLNSSLQSLGLEYVDCFLMHWPFAIAKTNDREVLLNADGTYVLDKELTANREPTWRAMEKLYKQGKTRSIGVSNFSISQLNNLLAYAEVKPAINQIEIHPLFPNTPLVDYCFSKDILPAAYSPLGSQDSNGKSKLIEHQGLQAIAQRKNVGLALLCISWGLGRGYVVLPKSRTKERIEGNFAVVVLSDEEKKEVDKVGEGGSRFVRPKFFGFDAFEGE